MRIAVSVFVAVSSAAMLAVWSGGDNARSSYSVVIVPPTNTVQLTILNPYPNVQAGSLAPLEIGPFTAPTLMKPEAPLAVLTPEPPKAAIGPIDLPAPAPPPEVAQPAIQSEPMPSVGTLDKAPPTATPEATQREAFAGPREVTPQEPRNVPARRQAKKTQSNTDALRVRFDGPAGAPFAHTRFCIKYPSECRVRKMVFRGGPIALTAELRQELIRINAEVNRSIIPTNMNEPVAEEKWMISPKEGDCNDYAVTKRHKLIARGWPARALLLAEVVTTWGEHHLVLVVRTREGDLVADNLNPNMRNWTKTPYEWVRVESPVNPMFWSKIKILGPGAVAMAARASQL